MERSQRRHQLLEAALACFSDKGYQSTHVSHIIDRAGVARGTFYQYFDGKQSIFKELVDDMFGRLDSVLPRIDAATGLAPLDQLRGNLEHFVGVLLKRPDLTRLLLSQAAVSDMDVAHRLQAFYRDLAGMLEQSLELGRQLGLVRDVDAMLVARALMGAVKEIFWEMATEGADYDEQRIADALWDLALHGVLQPA